MSMQTIVEKLVADQPVDVDSGTPARTSSTYEDANTSIERAQINGLVVLSIIAADGDGTPVGGTVELQIADVGGKFLLGDLCNSFAYQVRTLDKRCADQYANLARLQQQDRADEEHDDRIQKLNAALVRNNDNLAHYEVAYKAATELYMAFTGERFTPRGANANPADQLKTAARADAAATLAAMKERMEARKNARKAA